MGIRPLKGKGLNNRRPDWKIKRKESCGKAEEHNLVIRVRIWRAWDPVIGREKEIILLLRLLWYHRV